MQDLQFLRTSTRQRQRRSATSLKRSKTFVFPQTCFSIMGFLPSWKGIAKALPSLQVTRYSYSCPGIPMAAQVALPGIQVTRYSYSCPGIPTAAQVALPGLQVTRYSYSCPGIPTAAQVVMLGLQFTRLPINVWSRRQYHLNTSGKTL